MKNPDTDMVPGTSEHRERLLKDIIETLSLSQDEDRMALFTVLSIIVDYMHHKDKSKQEIDKQVQVIDDILERRGIYTVDELNQRVQDCALRLRYRDLLNIKPLGGKQ